MVQPEVVQGRRDCICPSLTALAILPQPQTECKKQRKGRAVRDKRQCAPRARVDVDDEHVAYMLRALSISAAILLMPPERVDPNPALT